MHELKELLILVFNMNTVSLDPLVYIVDNFYSFHYFCTWLIVIYLVKSSAY
jgi:hypothetical protein